MAQPFINAIATAVPPHEAHAVFREWAEARIEEPRQRRLFSRMADRSGIAHRWTVLAPPSDGSQTGFNGFYGRGMPPTSARMEVYAREAPDLVMRAAAGLRRLDEVTHLVLASCTGFVAPGIDQIVARRLDLASSVERTLVGFMGCYAAVAALRTARHIVRSEPNARVLVITVELCTLHLQADDAVDEILTMLLFGDGAAAAIVSAEPIGIALGSPFSATLPDSEALIGWTIGDTGFDMTLSGAVPAHIREAIATGVMHRAFGDPAMVDGWAVHAGGRTVLDAVEQGFDLAPEALADSRAVLRDCGNMSSATLMFVLARVLAGDRRVANGIALAFGPGLAIEGFGYRVTP